ncbi:MAG: hypothetical protein H7X89_03990 [Rhizobiales bacterium]|nr:hypothetical protein [Hyphomicrobiales bacterium]
MSLPVSIAFAMLTVVCVIAARRLARRQGRKALPWMVAAAVLGPFPLIPLALTA